MGYFPQDDTSIETIYTRPRSDLAHFEKLRVEEEARMARVRQDQRREEERREESNRRKSVDEKISTLFNDDKNLRSDVSRLKEVFDAMEALTFLTPENRQEIEFDGIALIEKHNYYPAYEKAYLMALDLKMQAFDRAVVHCKHVIDSNREACGYAFISKFFGMELEAINDDIDHPDSTATGILLKSLWKNRDMNAV